MKRNRTSFLAAHALLAILIPCAGTSVALGQETKPAQPTEATEALPEAQVIHDKFIEAIGGADTIKGLKTRTSKATLEFPQGNIKATVLAYLAEGSMYSVMEVPSFGQLESGVADGVAWQKNTVQGVTIMDGPEREELIRESDLQNEINFSKYYTKMETVGSAEVDGKKTYKVEFTPLSGEKQTRYFEADSGLLVKVDNIAVTPSGKLPVSTTLTDYRDVNGVKLAFKSMQTTPMGQFSMTYESITYNTDVPMDKLKLPDDVKAMAEKKKSGGDAPKPEAPKAPEPTPAPK
ncbi:MAG: hypothetical protein IT435_14085 [Phycisphaerales bacterium]|nr:hypothetical protein [Phycisphaerales bacterium]